MLPACLSPSHCTLSIILDVENVFLIWLFQYYRCCHECCHQLGHHIRRHQTLEGASRQQSRYASSIASIIIKSAHLPCFFSSSRTNDWYCNLMNSMDGRLFASQTVMDCSSLPPHYCIFLLLLYNHPHLDSPLMSGKVRHQERMSDCFEGIDPHKCGNANGKEHWLGREAWKML